MKRPHAWFVPIALVVCGIAAAARQSMTMPVIDNSKTGSKRVKIGLVTDVGQVDDGGYNQSAWEGAQAAAGELGGEASYLVTRRPSDCPGNIDRLVAEGCRIIVTVGFALGEETAKAAARHPDVTFIGVDQFQDKIAGNLAGLLFREDQSGFLAGILAAHLTRSNTIAAVLGTDQVPSVVAFKEGYEAGARYARPEIQVLSIYYPGKDGEAFTDPAWGAMAAAKAIAQGAGVVFGAAGKTGNGALGETARRTREDAPLYCIGVDTDQWGTIPEAHPCLVTSAMKMIAPEVNRLIKLAAAGTLKGGNIFGDVGLAPFHDFEKVVPDSLVQEIARAKTGLKSGKIAAAAPIGPAENPEIGGTIDANLTSSPAAQGRR